MRFKEKFEALICHAPFQSMLSCWIDSYLIFVFYMKQASVNYNRLPVACIIQLRYNRHLQTVYVR